VILHHHPLDDCRRDRVVIPEADVRTEGLVLPGDVRQLVQKPELVLSRRQIQRLLQPDCARNRFVDERRQ
jgi:hypothetical protein